MNFRVYDQNQGLFLPITLSKAIEENHLSRIINDIVESLDLSHVYNRYSEEGNPAYHPKMMIKVLFYCYVIGVFACRKIRLQLENYNLPLLYLSAGEVPSFNTINNFRKRHLNELPWIFTQIVILCVELGMVDFKYLAIDGQKIHANASLKQSKTAKGIRKEIKHIEEKMKELLNIEPKEDDGNKIENKKKKLEVRQEKITSRLEELEQLMEEEKNETKRNKMRINITDKDSPVMTHKDGSKKPSYLTLACVDSKFQIVTGYNSKNYFNESEEMFPLIENSMQNCFSYHAKIGLDSNFSSLDNLQKALNYSSEIYMPDRDFEKWKKDSDNMKFHKSKFVYDEDNKTMYCPCNHVMKLRTTLNYDDCTKWIYKGTECKSCNKKKDCTKDIYRTVTIDSRDYLQTSMREKLKTEDGKKEYEIRMYTVEPIFGNLQKNQKWEQFHLRSNERTKGEFGLHMIAHNLRKISLHIDKLKIDLKTALKQMNNKLLIQAEGVL